MTEHDALDKVSAIEVRIDALARISETSLMVLTLKDLEVLVKGLFNTRTLADRSKRGIVTAILKLTASHRDRLRQSEALAADLEVLDSRLVVTAIAPDRTDFDVVSKTTFKELVDIATNASYLPSSDEAGRKVSRDSEVVASNLHITYFSTLAGNTGKNYRLRLVRDLISQAQRNENPSLTGLLTKAIDSFRSHLYRLTTPAVILADKANSERVGKQNSSRTPVSSETVSMFYDTAYRWLTNADVSSWELLCVALAFATGRRSSEIMVTATFEPCEDSHQVLFSGQLKANPDTLAHDRIHGIHPPYPIPTLLPAELVLRGMEYLNASGKRLTKPEHLDMLQRELTALANKKFSKPISNTMRQYFGTEFTLKSLRAIYAELAFRTFSNVGERESHHSFVSRVMGHDIQSRTATDAYIFYNFPDATDDQLRMLLHFPL